MSDENPRIQLLESKAESTQRTMEEYAEDFLKAVRDREYVGLVMIGLEETERGLRPVRWHVGLKPYTVVGVLEHVKRQVLREDAGSDA